ncbi:MAG: hypothetical protein KJ989_15275 [Gammaproteobacteria bacterium]|uniref:Uncharacterized protein n=1 Tax=viral metagenome TaxID=1070528 RepID=A0A6M3KEG4_9ZZZZ|nr:hypothetical protein [Gammaproteobacteria bacterium]MBU2067479.1 hypothetical protein [Gammaproteobacteria bacterium]MBU2139489.1 hypothetical protein [Gammaproteobacteria bacterium]MBU2255916.1 hypothetical protein [Gammaproteobacteria bacterium]MBU2295561.1 hypothetical protein [Gammaproteobacteria bacterium]
MRSGQLDTPADLLVMDANLQPVVLDWLWVGIRSKESADPPAASGLRAPAKVTVRSWWDERLRAGVYLRADGRLLLIDDVRDFDNQRAEVVITCSELVGQPAEYRPQGGVPVACRVHLTHSAPYLDELGQVTDYKTRAEVAVIEVGRPEEGDQLLIAGTLYNVIAYARDSDDGVVRGLWLKPVV